MCLCLSRTAKEVEEASEEEYVPKANKKVKIET